MGNIFVNHIKGRLFMIKQKLTFKQKVKLFFKKNCYAIVVAGSALILAIALGVTAIVGSNLSKNPADSELGNINEPTGGIEFGEAEASSTVPVMFTYPVKDYTLGNTFTDNTLVYNKSLNEYTTHLGIDFLVADGTEVMASFSGTVESVTYDNLTGTVVVIDHGDGLKTSYASLASDVMVSAGQQVKAGEVIGTATASAGNEQNLGAHLHFSTLKDGAYINPMNYLGEK